MADERQPPTPEIDPDAPPSEDEVLASQRLRDALDESSLGDPAAPEDLDLVRSLRAAWSPEPLDERAHAQVLDDLPMSEDEAALAEELRVALEANGDAPEVVRALRAAWSPTALDEADHRAIVANALTTGTGEAAEREKGDGNVVRLKPRTMRLAVVTTTTVLALAASVVVWVTSGPTSSEGEAPLARARSTQSLFDEPFKAGETSARIDRIAVARASDYRDNRFAKWGVR